MGSDPQPTDRAAGLLRRFQPCLRYDSLESYFADSAELWVANPHSRLSDAAGNTIASAADSLSLSYLRPERYPDGRQVAKGDFIESTRGDYGRLYAELREANDEFRNVMYARSVESHDRLWLQYWFFYFFNDYQLAWGIGVHEGDWEMIQLRMRPPAEGAPPESAEPELAVYAQHNFCEVRPWAEVRRLAGEQASDGSPVTDGAEDRPLVYVGRGSHASFFEPGFHETDFYDVTNGKRKPKEVRLELVGDPPPGWLGWPGRWGGKRAGGNGPQSPCAQSQWDDPEKLLKRSPRVRRQKDAPDAPHVIARRRRGRLLLEFDFRATPEPPRWLVATVNSPDEKKVPPHAHSFGVEDVVLGSLDTRIRLEPHKHYDVSIAVVDRSDRPTAAEIVVFGPSEGWKGLRGRIGAAVGRLVHLIRLATGRQ